MRDGLVLIDIFPARRASTDMQNVMCAMDVALFARTSEALSGEKTIPLASKKSNASNAPKTRIGTKKFPNDTKTKTQSG